MTIWRGNGGGSVCCDAGKGWITADGTMLTTAGESALTALGLPAAHTVKRVFCCGCLDWSERRFHLGGYLGAALFTHCEQQGWLTRTPGTAK